MAVTLVLDDSSHHFLDLVPDLDHGPARGPDPCRERSALGLRGRKRRPRSARSHARPLPGLRMTRRGDQRRRSARAADAVAARAYAPYSRFHVGCAVLARDGRVIEGVNVENAAYPLGVCAERTASRGRIAEGLRPGDFVGRGDHGVAVRRVPPVAARDGRRPGRVPERRTGRRMTPDELLPESFNASDLRDLGTDLHAFGTKSCPTRTRFLVTIAVGGGPGCPDGRSP